LQPDQTPPATLLYEESVSDDSGNFRLRGLVPRVTYRIRVPLNNDSRQRPYLALWDGVAVASTNEEKLPNPKIERASPEFVTLEMKNADVQGAHFIAYRYQKKHEVTGYLHVSTSQYLGSAEVLLTSQSDPQLVLRPILHTRSGPSSSLSTAAGGGLNHSVSFFQFLSVPDDYFVLSVRSSLPARQYRITTQQFVVRGDVHVPRLEWSAELISNVNDVSAGAAITTLCLATAVLVVIQYRKQIVDWVMARRSASASVTVSSADGEDKKKRRRK